MEHGQETGFLRFSNPRTRMRPGFQSNDPFTPSIAQSIHNQRVTPGLQNMDDVRLPPRRNTIQQPHSRYQGPPFATDPGPRPIYAPATQPYYGTSFAPHYYPSQTAPIVVQPHGSSVIVPIQQPPQVAPTRIFNPIAGMEREQERAERARERVERERRSSRSRRSSPHLISMHPPAYRSHQPSSRRVHESRHVSQSPQSRSPYHRPRFRSPSYESRSPSRRHYSPHLSPTISDNGIPSPEGGDDDHALSPLPIQSLDSVEDFLVASRLDTPHSDSSLSTVSSIESQYTPAPHSIPSVNFHSSEHHGPILPPQSPVISVASHASEKTEHVSSKYIHPLGDSSTINGYPSMARTDEKPARLRDYVGAFVLDTLPRQVYLHFLLRLPSLYFTRVTRIFEEADLTLEEIKEMALQASAEDNKAFYHNMLDMGYHYPEATNISPAYRRLKLAWETFIDNLMREWKTLNIVSVLLLSAIMTMFQIQGAAEDPVTRYTAFWSLICALLSILYGCLFIIRFASMRKASKAAEWAVEAQKSQTILWNVWVMLAMPVVWMSWSILTFIACIMSFMWRASVNLPSDYVFLTTRSTELGFRIFVCVVLGTGVTYGILIINTFRRYGSQMDLAWQRRVDNFIMEGGPGSNYPTVIIHDPKAGSRLSSESDQTPFVTASLGARDLGEDPEANSTIPLPHPQHHRASSNTRPPSHHRSPSRRRSPTPARDDSSRGGKIVHNSSGAFGTPSTHHVSSHRHRDVSPTHLSIHQQDLDERRGRRRTRSRHRHGDRPLSSDGDKKNPQPFVSDRTGVVTGPSRRTEVIRQTGEEGPDGSTNRPHSRSTIPSNRNSKVWGVAGR